MSNGPESDVLHYHFSADEFYLLPILLVTITLFDSSSIIDWFGLDWWNLILRQINWSIFENGLNSILRLIWVRSSCRIWFFVGVVGQFQPIILSVSILTKNTFHPVLGKRPGKEVAFALPILPFLVRFHWQLLCYWSEKHFFSLRTRPSNFVRCQNTRVKSKIEILGTLLIIGLKWILKHWPNVRPVGL